MYKVVNILFLILCIATAVVKLERLEVGRYMYFPTDLGASPPIWITKKINDDIYVNQAKVISGLSNYEHSLPNGQRQVSYSIRNKLFAFRIFQIILRILSLIFIGTYINRYCTLSIKSYSLCVGKKMPPIFTHPRTRGISWRMPKIWK